jgi:hypothetical protein
MAKKILRSFLCLITLVWGNGCTSAVTFAPTPESARDDTPIAGQNHTSSPNATGSQNTQPASPHPGSIIGDILSRPDSYIGQQVEIVGTYRGWDLLKEVQGTPPVTRSDWVIADTSGAIYVTGIGPQGLDPASKQATTKIIRLVATVQQNENGVYLKVISVELVSTE